MLPEQLCLADKGYQGLAKLHPRSCTPMKKPKKAKLNAEERQYNQMLVSLRIVAEHTSRRLKVWRILAERYRNCRRRFELRFNLIAARCFADTARVVNIELRGLHDSRKKSTEGTKSQPR